MDLWHIPLVYPMVFLWFSLWICGFPLLNFLIMVFPTFLFMIGCRLVFITIETLVWFSYGFSLCFSIFFRLDRHASVVVPGFPMFSASPRYQPGMQLHKRSGANFSGDTRSEMPLAMSKPETEGRWRLRSPKGRDMEGFHWENIGETMGKST